MACCGPICRLRTQAFFSRASRGVAARMNSLAGMIFTSWAPRPARSVRSTMSRRNSSASSSCGCAEKMTSACRAAKSRPSGESPAWNSTGRYWALRGSRGVTSTE